MSNSVPYFWLDFSVTDACNLTMGTAIHEAAIKNFLTAISLNCTSGANSLQLLCCIEERVLISTLSNVTSCCYYSFILWDPQSFFLFELSSIIPVSLQNNSVLFSIFNTLYNCNTYKKNNSCYKLQMCQGQDQITVFSASPLTCISIFLL